MGAEDRWRKKKSKKTKKKKLGGMKTAGWGAGRRRTHLDRPRGRRRGR
jgi:hypothetical protein